MDSQKNAMLLGNEFKLACWMAAVTLPRHHLQNLFHISNSTTVEQILKNPLLKAKSCAVKRYPEDSKTDHLPMYCTSSEQYTTR